MHALAKNARKEVDKAWETTNACHGIARLGVHVIIGDYFPFLKYIELTKYIRVLR